MIKKPSFNRNMTWTMQIFVLIKRDEESFCHVRKRILRNYIAFVVSIFSQCILDFHTFPIIAHNGKSVAYVLSVAQPGINIRGRSENVLNKITV